MAGRFSRSAQRFLSLRGSTTLADVERINGNSGRTWSQAIQRAVLEVPNLVSSNISATANLLKLLISLVLGKYPRAESYEIMYVAGSCSYRNAKASAGLESKVQITLTVD